MPDIRRPCVAGQFYPAEADILSRTVDSFLDSQQAWDIAAKAIVAPHAGHIFSGAIAGAAFASVRHMAGQVRRIVLIGPAHRCPFRGIAVPRADAFETPLGLIPVDREILSLALTIPGVGALDQPFDGEHCLEVELPFLQRTFSSFTLVPMLVGEAPTDLVARVLETVWGGPETLIVVSSDLSHFHDAQTARRMDGETSAIIETLRYDRLSGDLACGFKPLAGLLRRACDVNLRATTIDQCTSGDTAYGDQSRVVGYGAYAFEAGDVARLSDDHRETLRAEVRRSIANAVITGRPAIIDPAGFPHPLRAIRNSFVTLHMDGRLRGCVGSLEPTQPLVVDSVLNAYRAAFEDPRFPELAAKELDRIEIAISILSHARPVPANTEEALLAALRPGVDGLILKDGASRALFLPKVWDSLPEPRDFVHHLLTKGKMPTDHWPESIEAFIFTAESF